MKKQGFTSAGTSINKTRLPKAYRYNLPQGVSVVDYGCGRYVAHLVQAARDKGWTWFGYDLYNRTEKENAAAVNAMKNGVDYIICSNVLNVIDSDDVVNGIICDTVAAARAAVVFTVYEGDGTGAGRQTGADQYQRNEKVGAYVERIQALGYHCSQKGGFITVTREGAK